MVNYVPPLCAIPPGEICSSSSSRASFLPFVLYRGTQHPPPLAALKFSARTETGGWRQEEEEVEEEEEEEGVAVAYKTKCSSLELAQILRHTAKKRKGPGQ